MIEIKIEGGAELAKVLERAAKDIPKARELFLRQEAELVKGRAKLKTPVDTGRLRAAWQSSEPSGEEIEVYNNTEYAAHVEYGHRVVVYGRDTGRIRQGEHMLRDALDESAAQFKVDAARILARVLK